MKVVTVVGARPQFVKAFPVSRALRSDHEEYFVHTGQHYDVGLSDVFFEELGLPDPDTHLGIGSKSHGRQTGEMLIELETVIDDQDPDAVLTYGDTNSTLAAAIAAAKRETLLAHAEAGLRSFERSMPEEINRVLTDHAADLLFAPTETAVDNLAIEGITDGVYRTGDVMYDALLWARERADPGDVRRRIGIDDRHFVLATVHRPRNADDPDRLSAILDALRTAPYPVVLPVHPRTRQSLDAFGITPDDDDRIHLIDPVGYLEFVGLLDAADRVVTDSGGVQKEAFLLDTPCLTLRGETEWRETVETGWNVLVGADSEAISAGLYRDFDPDTDDAPYGDGTAAERIVSVLADAPATAR
ncbi:non-hydrolyzing UDP-N-acetylglucosamine 2-epimerase [Halobacteriales archaeon Cl-PHB]